MIEAYQFGSMTVSGKRYHTDLKIIRGQVIAQWWRREGHRVDVSDIADILLAAPEILVIGQGDPGRMQVAKPLRLTLEEANIRLIEEPTRQAVRSFNRLYEEGENVAGAFHLTC